MAAPSTFSCAWCYHLLILLSGISGAACASRFSLNALAGASAVAILLFLVLFIIAMLVFFCEGWFPKMQTSRSRRRKIPPPNIPGYILNPPKEKMADNYTVPDLAPVQSASRHSTVNGFPSSIRADLNRKLQQYEEMTKELSFDDEDETNFSMVENTVYNTGPTSSANGTTVESTERHNLGSSKAVGSLQTTQTDSGKMIDVLIL